jgi:hypothetical protein
MHIACHALRELHLEIGVGEWVPNSETYAQLSDVGFDKCFS